MYIYTFILKGFDVVVVVVVVVVAGG